MKNSWNSDEKIMGIKIEELWMMVGKIWMVKVDIFIGGRMDGNRKLVFHNEMVRKVGFYGRYEVIHRNVCGKNVEKSFVDNLNCGKVEKNGWNTCIST